tara:strand:- start:2381 stop:3109 length:729 start_codon:yes stop_codon:yes gene_type:complete
MQSNENEIELFSCWTPIDIAKSMPTISMPEENKEEEKFAPISGLISSETKDLQGDTLLQGGVNWDYFLKKGWLNYEHKQGPEFIVGEPISLEKRDGSTYLKGKLYLNTDLGKAVYNTAKAISEVSDRRIGFSVEGQVLERDKSDSSIITKSRVLNVSVTAHPVNPDSTLEILARSLYAKKEQEEQHEEKVEQQEEKQEKVDKTPKSKLTYSKIKKIIQKVMPNIEKEECEYIASKIIRMSQQ